MDVIAFCNHKGGTGKTTSVLNTAAALGLSGNRVLVIDLDPQGFLSRMMGVVEPAETASSLMLFNPQATLADIQVRTLSGFDLVPSSLKLATRLLRKLTNTYDVFWVKEAIEKHDGYDYILIDTAAAITVFTLNAIVAAQHVIIPVTPEYQPVLGAEQAFRTARMVQDKLNPGLTMPHFLLTQVDGRIRNHQLFQHYLREKYEHLVLKPLIRTSTALSITHADGSTVFDHDAQSRGAMDYANAADAILQIIHAREAVPTLATEPAPVAGPTMQLDGSEVGVLNFLQGLNR